jgi:arsenate reductase
VPDQRDELNHGNGSGGPPPEGGGSDRERPSRGAPPERRGKLKVLFLCTGNSCRSQMAEGFARALKGDRVEPYSAGVEVHGLNELAVRAMAEAGVDISGQRSKDVFEVLDIPFDLVVTVCDNARERCPIFPRWTHTIHRGFDDPPFLARDAADDEEAMEHYRRVRDEIRAFVEGIDAELDALESRS